jgi:O-antigen biosynthesis protein
MRSWRSRLPVILISALFCLSNAAQAEDPYETNLKNRAMDFFRQGLQCEKAGDMNRALDFFHKSISTYPNFKEVHYKAAQTAATLGNNDEAMMEFRQALNIDNNFVECRNDYGLYLQRNKNDTEAAVKEWKKCIQIKEKYPFPYFNLGLVSHERGDLDAAIDYFTTVTRLKPEFAPAHRELGLCIFERAQGGDLETAVQALETSARITPDNPMVHYHLGFIYATKGNLDAGEAELRKALMCDPRLAAAHWELARLRYLRGDMDRCMTEIAEASKINPTYTTDRKYPAVKAVAMKTLNVQCIEYKGKLAQAIDGYYELARLRGSQDLYAKHIEDLQKKIKLIQKTRKKTPLTYDPEEIDALVAKGIELVEDGDLDGAKASFERALELNPNSVEACMNLAGVQEAQGDLNAAVASNQKAIAANPEFDGAYYNLGFLLEKMNLPTEAGVQYDKFRQIAGKYPYDPRHVVELQQEMIRRQKIEENAKTRGY